MAANIEEKVIEKLLVLPEDQQAEVLKFVEDWDKIEEIMRDVPDEVLASIPTPSDGGVNQC